MTHSSRGRFAFAPVRGRKPQLPLAGTNLSTTRQRLSFDRGRVSTIRTLSPIWQELCSSCALYFTWRVTYLPYCGCLTRRSTRTTTVLSILFEVTMPILTFGLPRICNLPWLRESPGLADSQLLLTQHREGPGDLLPRLSDVRSGVEPPRTELHAEIEEVCPKLGELLLQLLLRESPKLLCLHRQSPTVSRRTILVRTGSLKAARRRASRATSSFTPWIS